jgi:PAS domain S-box-containing protein
MRLRTQFIITMLLFGFALVVVAVSAVITDRQVEKTGQQERIAAHIAQGASELSYLANDYLIYRESQQLKRWQSRFASFSAEVAALRVDRPEQQTLAANIKANQQRLKEVFGSVLSAVGDYSQNRGKALDLAFLQVSWSRVAVQSQGLASDASRLSQLLHQQMDQLTKTGDLLLYVVLSLMGIFLLVTYMLSYRRILKSIMTLRAGTAVIGSGNLDFVIEEGKEDEIGELSQAFNRMTADLKAVTASKADLEREIAERERAEGALRESEEHYRSLFDNMLNGYAYCRMLFEEGKPQDFIYLNVNSTFETLTGLKSVTGKKVSEVIPGLRESDPEIFEIYGRVATTGFPERFETYVEALGMWFSISVYSPRKEHFVAIFDVITEQKNAEKKTRELLAAVQQERDRLSALVNSISDEVWFADTKKQFTLENLSALQEFGIGSSDGAIDVEKFAASLEVYRPDGSPRPVEEAPSLRALRGETVRNLEEIIRTPSKGELRYRQVNAAPVKDAEGHIIGSVSVVRDITERKRMEESLRESEERYKNLVKYAPAAIYEMDLQGTRLFSVNEVMCDILRYSREELLSMKPTDLMDPESRSLFKERIRKKLAGEKIDETVEYRIRRKDGEWIYTDINVGEITYTDENPARVVVVGHDITERKRIEEALRESEARYRNLVKYAPAGIYEVDFATARFTEVNDAMCQILGYSREEILAMTAFEILEPEDRSHFASRISHAQSGGQLDEVVEYRVRTKDCRLIWALLNITFHWNGGRIVRATVVSYDITERRRMEEALRRSRDELEVRVQERTAELARTSELLRDLSSKLLSTQEAERKRIAGEIHDTLGAGLAAIKFKVEYFQQQMSEVSGAATESLDILIPLIQENIDVCRRIQQDLRPSMLDDLGLLPTLSWFCRRYQTIFTGIKVELGQTVQEKDIPDSLKTVIFRVMQEAMNNIAKHSKADLVHLSLGKRDGRIELVLEDNGQGFDMKKVLDSESTKRGLGLTSMRERTELSGGSFSVESAEGKGTVIRAIWPS